MMASLIHATCHPECRYMGQLRWRQINFPPEVREGLSGSPPWTSSLKSSPPWVSSCALETKKRDELTRTPRCFSPDSMLNKNAAEIKQNNRWIEVKKTSQPLPPSLFLRGGGVSHTAGKQRVNKRAAILNAALFSIVYLSPKWALMESSAPTCWIMV